MSASTIDPMPDLSASVSLQSFDKVGLGFNPDPERKPKAAVESIAVAIIVPMFP
jgi:hypothetical protein